MTQALATSLHSKPAPTLTQTMALTEHDLQQVNALILARVEAEIPLIRDITHHLIAAGGKRLRPLLTLLCAKLCGYEGTRHLGLAASVEFLHTATLLHDDVVDESKLRRGLATANDIHGNKASVLVGDFLLSQAFQMMVADGSLDVLDILSRAAGVISQGEVKQLMTIGELETPVETYMDVITCKTAALFCAACEIGAVVADKPKQREALRNYGTAVGIAFQLVDDALDYSASEEQLGKAIGDDFREGKITLPVLIAYQNGSAPEREFWHTAYDSQQAPNETTLAQARNLITAHDAISQTFTVARRYCDDALEALSILPDTSEKVALREIVNFCAGRMY